jgi:hypothetical protein
MGTKIKWEGANFLWNSNPYTWNEVEIAAEVIGSSGGWPGLAQTVKRKKPNEILQKVEKLDKEKKERFIKLVCKIRGIETYSGQKTVKEDIKVTVKDIELIAKEVLGIDLTAENIHV